ncbi:hypothetical protein DERP_011394 [Dermatophagoides pteronyssinus]|uniref:Uncharacterized protein n=1 Tax=Dermatophagoides pteronyssinus TaxID=6956 RepID=A0ABQ8J519_DERPT|nr:hypothetical protein DERP_011394 [Dermatophagoides pteronyssinus]
MFCHKNVEFVNEPTNNIEPITHNYDIVSRSFNHALLLFSTSVDHLLLTLILFNHLLDYADDFILYCDHIVIVN